MSSKPYTLLIAGEEKRFKGSINIDLDVYTIGVWDAAVYPAEELAGFDLVSIEREGTEIFGGRVEQPRINFSTGGRAMPTRGFDHTVRLRDYKTPFQTLTDVTTVSALTSIVSETPFNISTSGTFEYITELQDWDTWLEMVTGIEVFTNVTVELDISTVEISDLVNAGTWTGCANGLKSTFFYDGATQRFYIFVKNAANDLYYYHSVDGDTWIGVDTGYNPTGDAWTVAWHSDKVYLFIYDGANTDFYRGTINNPDGVITFGVATANIFADEVIFGPVFDDSDHLWILRNNAGGNAYESTDDGATFNSRFTAGADELHAILPTGTDGDMVGFELDTVNSDLEEWLWDRSAGTYTFQNKITNEDDVDLSDACCDASYNPYFSWIDANVVYLASDKSGGWLVTAGESVGASNNVSIGSDGYSVYVSVGYGAGFRAWKYVDTTEIQDSGAIATYATPTYISCPRGYLQDGQIAIFWGVVSPSNDDIYFHAFSQLGLRLVEGSTTGTIRTETVTASGGFTNWGVCSASGNADLDDTLWNILKSATNAELIDDQLANFDMNLAGVPNTELTIKVTIDFDGTGVNDPIVYEFSVTERTDNLTISTDGEDAYSGVTNLADLSGAEFWVTKDNGTYTINFSTRRGEDKSSYIVLKCATTGDEPDTNANLKVLNKTFDYTDFANAILFIGGLDALGNRVEVEVRDTASITARGQEYWFTVRDASVTTVTMGRTIAVLELNRRNAVVERLRGDFVDKWAPNVIGIGDSVYLIGEWQDGDLKIDGSFRIVALKRSWGVGGGERVSAEFSNRLKPIQYYNYLKKVNDLEVISTL